MRFFLAFAFLAFFGSSSHASSVIIPDLSSPVIDEVGWLTQREESELAQRLLQIQERIQFQIWIFDSLQGESIEQVSLRAAEKWRLGRQDKDNGLLVAIAVQDRKIRLEVGQGLEGQITDLQAGRLIRGTLAPLIQRGQHFRALLSLTERVQQLVDGPSPSSAPGSAVLASPRGGGAGLGFVVIGLFALVLIKALLQRRWLLAGTSSVLSSTVFVAAWVFFGVGAALIFTLAIVFLFLTVAYPGLALALLQSQVGRRRSGAWGGPSFGRGGSWSGGGGGFSGGGASGGW